MDNDRFNDDQGWHTDPLNEPLYHRFNEDEIIAQTITEDTIAADSLTEDTIAADSVTESSTSQDKPEFGIWKYGRFGPPGDYFATESTGPQITYINERLGLSGDEYTQDTFERVIEYQRENKIEVSGRVDKATYDAL